MIKKIIDIDIPRRSLIFLLSALVCLLIFTFGIIIPYGHSLSKLDEKIQNARFELEEQRLLASLHGPLIQESDQKKSRAFAMPAIIRLSREKHEDLATAIRTQAQICRLETVTVSPDVSSLTAGQNFIIVNAVLKGDFTNLRTFLIKLGEIQYLENTEEINIRQQTDKMEFKLKLRFATH